MALNTLTLSTTNGVQGRRFAASIIGISPGSIVTLDDDATPGFSTVNGRVTAHALPYRTNTVAIRERAPSGETKVTRIDITTAALPVLNILSAPVPDAISAAGSADVVGKSSGTTLTLATNPDNAWTISGATLSWSTGAIGKTARPVIVETAGLSGSVARESLLASSALPPIAGGGGAPSAGFDIASNRLRLGQVWNQNTLAAGVFGFDAMRIRTANSTTNGVFIVDNSVLDILGVSATPPNGGSGSNKIRRFQVTEVGVGTVIPIQYNGVNVTPETGMVPIATGQKLKFTPATPLKPNTEYLVQLWDECPQGNWRPGVYAGESRISGEATRTGTTAFDAAGAAAPTTITSSYVHMNACLFMAEGVTGPVVAEFADSLEDQNIANVGANDHGWLRQGLASLTGGFIPNMGTIRFSGSGNATYTDNFGGTGCKSVLTWWDEITTLIGQTRYPFNRAVYAHFRNNAATGRMVAKAFMNRLSPKFTAEGAKIVIVTPIPATNISADGNTTEASQTPFTATGNPYAAGGERDLYLAETRTGTLQGYPVSIIDVAKFVRGANDVRVWPTLGAGGLLKTATAAASPTSSIKVSGTGWRVGDYVVFDPDSTTAAGMDNTGKRVTVVTDNGDGTVQLNMRNAVAKDYPVDTVVRRTASWDGTHESNAFMGDMAAWFIANAKGVLADAPSLVLANAASKGMYPGQVSAGGFSDGTETTETTSAFFRAGPYGIPANSMIPQYANSINGSGETSGLNPVRTRASVVVNNAVVGEATTIVTVAVDAVTGVPIASHPAIPPNGGFLIRSLADVDAGGKWPLGRALSNTLTYPGPVANSAIGEGSNRVSAVGGTNPKGTDRVSDASALAASNNPVVFGWAPCGILAPVPATLPRGGVIGTSLSAGVNDTYGEQPDRETGWTHHVMYKLGCPYSSVARSADTMYNWLVNRSRRVNYFEIMKPNFVINELATNDINSSSNYDNVLNNVLIRGWDATKALCGGGMPVYAPTILPRTAPGNGATAYTTDATVRQPINTWLRDGAPLDISTRRAAATGTASSATVVRMGHPQHPLAGMLDAALSVEDPAKPGFWLPAYAPPDGIHPTLAGHAKIANDVFQGFNPQIQAASA